MQELSTTQYRRALALLFALALAAVLAFQGTRGLYESTEGRYAECARQMLERGQLDEPFLNGKHHWTKPPLTYWAIMAGVELFGTNAWGARAYLAVAYLASVAAVVGAGRALWGDRRVGLAAGLAFATSPFVLAGAWTVATDMLVCLWQALAVWCFLRARGAARGRALGWIVAMWLAFGLGFLTKGPPALLALIGIAALAWIERRGSGPEGAATAGGRRPALRHSIWHPLGLVAFAAVAFPWFIYENHKFPGLIRYWIMDETIARNTRDEFERNPAFHEGLVMYLPILLAAALPWLGLIVARGRAIPWPRGWGRGGAGWRPWTWPHGREWTFLLISLGVPLALFLLSKSKLPLYVLPLIVPVALALGKGLVWLLDAGQYRLRSYVWAACGTVAVFTLVKAGSGLVELKKDMKQVSAMIDPIVASKPGYALYSNYDDHLNGLQFHRQMQIPIVDSNAVDQLLEERLARGQGTLILIREHRKENKTFRRMLKRGLLKIEVANKEWTLLSSDP